VGGPGRAAAVRFLAAGAVAALVALAFFLPSYALLVATEILILGTFALGFNLLFGYAGLLSFGQAAFFGAGAYAAAFLLLHGVQSVWLVLLAGTVAAALLALPLGALAVRRDEIYFSILTLGLGMMVNAVAWNWREVTGGSDGLTGFGVPKLGLVVVEVALARPRNMYLLALAVAVLVVLLLRRIVASPFGLLLQASRENRERIAFVGGSVARLRLVAFVLSASVSGLAGVLFAIFNRVATPDMAHWSFSARPVLMTVLGGAGTFLGPLVGAAAFYGLEQAVTAYTQNWMIVLGALLVPIVILLPKGILGTATDLAGKLRRRAP
jgi:branched-chain amino acid transport system permease protein